MALRLSRQNIARLAPRTSSIVRQQALKSFVRFNSSAADPAQKTNSEEKSTPPPPPPTPKSGNTGILLAALGGIVGGGYWYYSQQTVSGKSTLTAESATYEDYNKVYQAIAQKLEDEDDYEDGSYGPVVVRLAWHSSGTYDKNAGDGGSGPGTMNHGDEQGYDANAGLDVARSFLKPIHNQFPWISSGDLYTLAGVCAIQEMQGPQIRWRAGRSDRPEMKSTPDGRLPDGGQGAQHVRDIFYRMGFSDQEIVALIGAHALGRCHTDRSGFDGPWTFSPTVFTNDFYTLLKGKWHYRKWDGPKQLQDDDTNSLMMLPADYSLVQDKKFKEYVNKYADDQDLFFKDFSAAFEKLLELGVKFEENTPHWTFKSKNGEV